MMSVELESKFKEINWTKLKLKIKSFLKVQALDHQNLKIERLLNTVK